MLAIATAAALTACSGSASTGPDKYEQTWTKSYQATTCGDWTKAMDDHQKFVMAADMLFAVRDVDLPPQDEQTESFRDAISIACRREAAATSKVVVFAAIIYEAADEYKP